MNTKNTDWRGLVTYPAHVRWDVAETLDVLAALLPVPCEGFDRYSRLSDWLESAYQLGVILRPERMALRTELAQHL